MIVLIFLSAASLEEGLETALSFFGTDGAFFLKKAYTGSYVCYYFSTKIIFFICEFL
jgi:hypothetical protein